jgi:hypothetical protein
VASELLNCAGTSTFHRVHQGHLPQALGETRGRPPVDPREREVARLRREVARLHAAFARLWAEGRALPLQDVVAYARDHGTPRVE